MLLNRGGHFAVALATIFALTACAATQPIVSTWPVQEAAKRTAPSGDLIYAGSADGKHLYIFSYPKGKLVREFAPPTGTIALEGLCSDTSGNVYVASLSKLGTNQTVSGHVYEYAHGGTKVLKTLSFDRGRPFGCSVDPSSGTLAVSSAGFGSGGIGEIETFSPGSNYGKIYYGYDIQSFYYCAYDVKGNLFVNGEGIGTQMYLAELKKGATQLEDLSLNKYVSVSGMGELQWDGSHVTLEDLTADAIYQLSASASLVSVVGQSHLDGWNGSTLSAISGTSVIVPNGVSETAIGFWKYPAGGKESKSVSSPSGLFGLTISAATHR
ncbi:MAG: hypothetical protein WCB01_01160 [Candidatus Cybelea sp.]